MKHAPWRGLRCLPHERTRTRSGRWVSLPGTATSTAPADLYDQSARLRYLPAPGPCPLGALPWRCVRTGELSGHPSGHMPPCADKVTDRDCLQPQIACQQAQATDGAARAAQRPDCPPSPHDRSRTVNKATLRSPRAPTRRGWWQRRHGEPRHTYQGQFCARGHSGRCLDPAVEGSMASALPRDANGRGYSVSAEPTGFAAEPGAPADVAVRAAQSTPSQRRWGRPFSTLS